MSHPALEAARPDVHVAEVSDALLVWVASTTVAAERQRLARELSSIRSVFGAYAERSQAGVQRLVDDLRELETQPDQATLIPVPQTFGATHASRLLPRGGRVVGWLDADGYRAVADTPQPARDWLDARQDELRRS
jgi:hypothetical protein